MTGTEGPPAAATLLRKINWATSTPGKNKSDLTLGLFLFLLPLYSIAFAVRILPIAWNTPDSPFSRLWSLFLFFLIFLFIYLTYLAALGLQCFVQTFSSCSEQVAWNTPDSPFSGLWLLFLFYSPMYSFPLCGCTGSSVFRTGFLQLQGAGAAIGCCVGLLTAVASPAAGPGP